MESPQLSIQIKEESLKGKCFCNWQQCLGLQKTTLVSEKQNDWDENLSFVLSAYHSSVHTSTSCTPNSFVYARETNLPMDLMLPGTKRDAIKAENYPEYVQWVRKTFQTPHTFARKHLQKSLMRNQQNYNAYAKSRPPFKEGQMARYYYLPIKISGKFIKPWTGPWKVIKQVTEVDYRIARLADLKNTRVVHIDHLKF